MDRSVPGVRRSDGQRFLHQRREWEGHSAAQVVPPPDGPDTQVPLLLLVRIPEGISAVRRHTAAEIPRPRHQWRKLPSRGIQATNGTSTQVVKHHKPKKFN